MAGNYNPNRDIEIVDQPQDSVSSLKWSPKANFLAASSWDNKVRVWQVENNGHNKPVTATTLEAPLLDCCWTGVCENVDEHHYITKFNMCNTFFDFRMEHESLQLVVITKPSAGHWKITPQHK